MKIIRTAEYLLLVDKEINVKESPVLFSERITRENVRQIFDIYNSNWTVTNGWLTGINPDESAGMAVFKKKFPGNILLEFECRTVKPSTHDINFMWNGEWSPELNSCGNAYIGSICGWHTGRTGIEKSPGYKFRVTCPNTGFMPGKTYKVQTGSINGKCFIFIDGSLSIEADDPDPLDNNKYSSVAFTAWSSHIQIRNIIIRQAVWKPVEMVYHPEF